MKAILSCLLIAFALSISSHAQPRPVPIMYELACPAGYSPVAGFGKTFDSPTGKWRANVCVSDSGDGKMVCQMNGCLTSAVTLNGTQLLGTPGFQVGNAGAVDSCVFAPGGNGIDCVGNGTSELAIDFFAVGISLTTPAPNFITLAAGANNSKQTNDGWYSSHVMSSDQHTLASRCESKGSAANPSVVDCTTNPGGGAFSCATNASGATCRINDQMVCVAGGTGCLSGLTTTSTIAVWQVTDEGAVLGVTCNTTPTNSLVSARVSGASFTLTLGTFSVNPLCFNFLIH